MDEIIAVELDVVADDANELKSWLDAMSEKHSISYDIVTLDGPGGGNPLVKFTGTKQNLMSFVDQDYDPDNDCEILELGHDGMGR